MKIFKLDRRDARDQETEYGDTVAAIVIAETEQAARQLMASRSASGDSATDKITEPYWFVPSTTATVLGSAAKDVLPGVHLVFNEPN